MKQKKIYHNAFLLILLAFIVSLSGCAGNTPDAQNPDYPDSSASRTVIDIAERSVEIPASPQHVICSSGGSLRLLTYLQAEDMIVGVDSAETSYRATIQPYTLANPQFSTDYPVFGEARGADNPEKILGLDPMPDIIIKIYPPPGTDPIELQERTGIPVVTVSRHGDLISNRDILNENLRIVGEVAGREERAEEVITFFDEIITDLRERTDIPEDEKISCYIGGIGRQGGSQGLQSTEVEYPPFHLISAHDVLHYDTGLEISHETAQVSKEKILEWDPDIIFVDLYTLQSDDKNSALYQLRNDPSYQQLQAVQSGNVYGVLPYNVYGHNFDTALVNSYFIGKVLYPERFEDVDLEGKSIEIFQFLVCEGDEACAKEVYDKMTSAYEVPAFTKLDV
ncbi:iron ABC transporter substrate-binding protein [Methanolobus psychrotolerans]|uniref:iron ABC transporter substrate-binding protein n=1 Tax=Methanolobus psychrotolerans TaxID=1874706 RepID=UPI000B91B774|nr:iron ABC transporter substrate-binding protein [Methanolobus psychrotolerans]